MKLTSLEKLYAHELKDLFSAENQILQALPRMIERARDGDLVAALEDHRDQTATHVSRLQDIFKGLSFEPGGHKCKGVEGLLKEGDDVVSDCADSSVCDAAIIAACQRIEHYEMAGYGSARAFAQQLGRHDDADILSTTLDEEGATDRTLSQLAERRINFAAMAGASD